MMNNPTRFPKTFPKIYPYYNVVPDEADSALLPSPASAFLSRVAQESRPFRKP